MKNFLLLLVIIMSATACDDGDIAVDDINFEDVQLQRCAQNDDILYKIAATESMILYLPQDAAFLSDETDSAAPVTFPIGNLNRVVYRAYDGDVSTANICEIIQPADPSVTEEWNAVSGTIEIVTTAVQTENPALPGGQTITGYRHAITFRNVTFIKPDGNQQLYEEFIFGSFISTEGVVTFPFAFEDNLQKCGANRIFKYINSEALTLDIDPALIANEVTPVNSPRVGYTGTTTNRLSYRLFANGILSTDYFCADPVPQFPTVLQEWVADDGTEITGKIEVITTTSGPGTFQHVIRIKNAVMRRGNTTFILAADYLLGYLITS